MYQTLDGQAKVDLLWDDFSCWWTDELEMCISIAVWKLRRIFELPSETKSIHLEHVEIPGVVGVGESPTLVCDVDLEPDELYSVKWYKDNDEFYRFMPKSEPTTQIYPVEGILVDVSQDFWWNHHQDDRYD